MPWVSKARRQGWWNNRIRVLSVGLGLFATAVVLRLFVLQVIEHGFYAALAQDQHQLEQQLYPTRGDILVQDKDSATKTYPLATNQTLHLLYAVPKQIANPASTAQALSQVIPMSVDDLMKRVNKPNDLYEPIMHNLSDAQMTAVKALKIAGLFFSDESVRYYPEKNIGGQLLGFVGYQGDVRAGRYGIEGAFDKYLAGVKGFIKAQKDASGQLIATATQFWQPAVNGSDVVLTIDRTIEYEACTQLDAAVKKHGADSGSIVIMDPHTGAILALCSSPDFDPNSFNTVTDPAVFMNQATQVPYEPGSVFKAITMAAALDQGKVTPDTTYTDTGEVKIGSFTIKNSGLKAHGVQTMTYVLEQSLNTGAIFAMRQIGPAVFDKYLHAFGFGQTTGVEIPETAGSIAGVDTGKEIYSVTGSFGQGLTVTPLQLAAAYGAIANGGKLMRPYVVDEIRHPDGTATVTKSQVVRQVISPQTAATLSAMLVRVVQNGHGKKAGVNGYFVAGKTGTAQIPDPQSGGYLPNLTIGTFAGFAPVDNPRFVMVTQLVKPRDVQFAESSAAPLFGDLAKFLLMTMGVPSLINANHPMKSFIRSVFMSLAARILRRYHPMVVAVAGSVGKTATKEAVAVAITAKQRTVRRTIGSFNAEIGVPTTIITGGPARTSVWGWAAVLVAGVRLLSRRMEYPNALVLELGADKPGDLQPLLRLTSPRCGVLTAMTAEHLEYFLDLDNVEAEESQVVTSLPPEGIAILNIDDPRIAALVPSLHCRIISFGWDPSATVQALSASPVPGPAGIPTGMLIRFSLHGTVTAVALPGVLGRHQVYPILAAVAVGVSLGDELEAIITRLSEYRPPEHRMSTVLGTERTLLIDDSYNASPAAMEAAIETLGELPMSGRKYAILGQMSELGATAAKAHERLGELLRADKLDRVILIGPFGPQIRAGARRGGFPLDRIVDAANAEAAAAELRPMLRPGDAVLIKGSRYPKEGYSGFLDRAVAILRHAPADT